MGDWYDPVYLSRDNQWDIDNTLIGRFEYRGRLEPGATYTGQLDEPLPGVAPGNYYIIVRADARNTIRETDDTNNFGVTGPVSLDVIELLLGVPFNHTLTPSVRTHFYKVNVPAGQTLLWTVDSQLETVETELFVRYNAMAQALPFGIRSVTPNIVGNAGFASLRIQGAQFEAIERVFLITPGGERKAALVATTVSPSEIRALFNGRGVEPGSYALAVRKRSGEEAVLNNAV